MREILIKQIVIQIQIRFYYFLNTFSTNHFPRLCRGTGTIPEQGT